MNPDPRLSPDVIRSAQVIDLEELRAEWHRRHAGDHRGRIEFSDRPIAKFRMSQLMRDTTITLHVALIRDWRFRIGLRLMQLGARLMGSRLEVSPKVDENSPR